MRGFLIFLGLILMLAGAAAAGAQFAPVDLSMLDSIRGARELLLSPLALYAGGGTAAAGLLLVIAAAATGRRKDKPAGNRTAKASLATQAPAASSPAMAGPAPPDAPPAPGLAQKPPAPPPEPRRVTPPPPAPPASAPQAARPATAAAPIPTPSLAKPTASGQPPASATLDPRLANRRRVQDLVTINDALKAYRARHGAYPKATGLAGFAERGEAWIPGLAPDFLKELPRDPALLSEPDGPQYVYASDGTGYKLLAQNISLVGSNNVEVLGVRFDPVRPPRAESAAFGFWTESFAAA